jgi:hypothetical protein
MEIHEPFNPLNKKNLGLSVAEAMLQKPVVPLPPGKFAGAGIYAIYYVGGFEPYRRISERNREDKWLMPIYVGKAIPAGARRGGLGLDAPTGQVLHARLKDHAKSVDYAQNLRIEDFGCRYLLVDDIWIPLGESLLIEMFRPLWNSVIDGFGNHDQGISRITQIKSSWDTLHPGRSWADRHQQSRSIDEILGLIEARLRELDE